MGLGIGGVIGLNFASDLLGGLLSSGISYHQANRLMTKQQEWNRQQAEWQNQVNVQNWQMQNEYNTPSNQMKRLQDAGLNPNLMYGNGSASTGNATGAPDAASVNSVPMSAPRANINFSRFGTDAMQAAISLRQQDNNDKLAQSQVDYNRAKSATEEAKALNLMAGTDLTKWDLEKGQKLFDILKGNEELRGLLMQSQINSNEQGIAESNSRIKVNEKTVEEKAANIQLIQARTGLTINQAALVNQQIGEVAARILLMRAQTDESLARKLNINASTSLTNERSIAQHFNNVLNHEYRDLKVEELRQGIIHSINVNQRGQVQLNREAFENSFVHTFGAEPGDRIDEYLVGSIAALIKSIGF